MSKQGRLFLFAFLPTAAAVFALVSQRMPIVAVVAGTVGLVIHWRLSAQNGNDGELADSSYFFGFLLTLVFLATGLFDLGALGEVSSAERGQANVVFVFLKDLAAGLILTIVGLVVRQIRTLSAPAQTTAEPMSGGLTAAQLELANAMRLLVGTLRNHPAEASAREFEEARVRARTAAEELERNITVASTRMASSVSTLEEAVTSASTALTRSGSSLGDALSQTAERIQIHVAEVLAIIDAQRRQVEQSLRQSQDTAEETQREVGARVTTQLEQWRTSLDRSRIFLTAAHDAMEAEYRRALVAVSTAGSTFAGLAEQVAHDVEALPNPAERLTGVWDRVRELETTLAKSISEASTQLATLSDRARTATTSVTQLGESSGTAAASVERGGAELGETLHRDLQQMIRILDEYTMLLERRIGPVTPPPRQTS
jgi:hypothetical protein